MDLKFTRQMSRLKKKLLLYFILIAIVSISVSAEIILEMSVPTLRNNIKKELFSHMEKKLSAEDFAALKNDFDEKKIFAPISSLRNRMILLLLVVSTSIIMAFFLFTKDIVSPMDGMVEATKKIADGDLTVTVPVLSEDEIGLIAGLINDMNVNLQDMIMQIKQEVMRHKEQILVAKNKLDEILKNEFTDDVVLSRKMKLSDFKKILKLGHDVAELLENMTIELSALQAFVNMYKIYRAQTEVTQEQLDVAFKDYDS